MEITYRAEILKKKISKDKEFISNEISKEKVILKDIIKLNINSKLNLNNLKTKVDFFYNGIDVDYKENKINFDLNKAVIFYFSIFNSFEYIILLYLYINGNFNLSYTKNFNDILVYLNSEYDNKKKEIKKKILNIEDWEIKDLFFEITKYLNISLEKKNDIEFIKQKFEKYKAKLTSNKSVNKEITDINLLNDKRSNYNEKISILIKNISKIENDIENKKDYINNLSTEILTLKMKVSESKIKSNLEKQINNYKYNETEYQELKEERNYLINKLETNQKYLEDINEMKEIKPKYKEKNVILKKIEILGEKPRLINSLEEINNEIKQMEDKINIDKELVINTINIIEIELVNNEKNILKIELELGKSKIENTSNFLLKKKNSQFEELKKEQNNLENELKNKKNLLHTLSKNLKKIDNKDIENKIKFFNKNKNFVSELDTLEQLEIKVKDYINYIIYIENIKLDILNKVRYENLKIIIDSETKDIKIGDEIFKNILEIFKWKLNINIQIDSLTYLGFSKNDIINGLNFCIFECLKNKPKILFNSNINKTEFMKCYYKIKNLTYDLNSKKKMEEILDVMVDDVEILNKFS